MNDFSKLILGFVCFLHCLICKGVSNNSIGDYTLYETNINTVYEICDDMYSIDGFTLGSRCYNHVRRLKDIECKENPHILHALFEDMGYIDSSCDYINPSKSNYILPEEVKICIYTYNDNYYYLIFRYDVLKVIVQINNNTKDSNLGNKFINKYGKLNGYHHKFNKSKFDIINYTWERETVVSNYKQFYNHRDSEVNTIFVMYLKDGSFLEILESIFNLSSSIKKDSNVC